MGSGRAANSRSAGPAFRGQLALQNARLRSDLAQRLESANTWRWSHEGWHADNTDAPALREWLAPLAPNPDVVVWGGGGTLAALREALPQATYYSAREGKPREGQRSVAPPGPKNLVWASSVKGVEPPPEWRVRRVWDLSNRENSAGRAYAQRVRAEYFDGTAMFKAQAKGQREYWSKG